jgi:Copper transport outer membrane protein, MctB
LIDFRYHIVSIIAVFLALAIGMLMGSLVLGEALERRLRRDLEDISNRNDTLREEIVDLNRQVDADEAFALEVRPYLIDEVLEGEEVVVFTYGGTDEELTDEVQSSLEDAGAVVATTMTATSRLDLGEQADVEELAAILETEGSDPGELRATAGAVLGDRSGDVALNIPPQLQSQQPTQRGSPTGELEALIDGLAGAGFVEIETRSESPIVPPGASFVIVGGSEEDPPFDVSSFTVNLGEELANEGAGVLAAEPSNSTWDLVEALLNDAETVETVATVDQAESVSGSIAVVLALDRARAGDIGHYGVGSGADAIIPESSESP